MSIDLSNYSSIESALLVRIDCDFYKASNSADPFTTQVLRFSDYLYTVTLDGDNYIGLGRLMAVTSSSSELRVTNNDLTLTLSGIPNTSIDEIINSRIKGSTIKIYRALINPATGLALSIAGNPMMRYSGIINNYGIDEDFDGVNRTATNTISLTCSSFLDVLNNTAKGRRTNPEDQKKFYPSDLSMDRVPNLVRSKFNFGAAL